MGVVALLLALASPAVAAVIASGSPEAAAFERFSVLTPPGPEQARPEILAKSRRLIYAQHRVQKGEAWIGNLAKSYGSTLSAFQTTNNNEFVFMYPGMRLTVLNRDGLLYEVRLLLITVVNDDPALLVRSLELLGPLFAPGARVVAKHFWRDSPPSVVGLLASERERRFGETALTFYRRQEAR